MTWAAVAGAGASIVGGVMSGEQRAAATGAANEANVAIENARLQQQANLANAGFTQQTNAANAAAQQQAALQNAQREQQQSNRDYGAQQLNPYNTAGQQATAQQQALLGLSGQGAQQAAMQQFTESPGQAFLRRQQERTTLRNAAATGGLRGGNVQKALQEQAFGRAQTDYGNYFNRLSGLSGQGLSAGQSLVADDTGIQGAITPQTIAAAQVGSSLPISYTAPEVTTTAGRLAGIDLGGNLLGGVDNTFGTNLRGSLADPVATVGNVFGGGK